MPKRSKIRAGEKSFSGKKMCFRELGNCVSGQTSLLIPSGKHMLVGQLSMEQKDLVSSVFP